MINYTITRKLGHSCNQLMLLRNTGLNSPIENYPNSSTETERVGQQLHSRRYGYGSLRGQICLTKLLPRKLGLSRNQLMLLQDIGLNTRTLKDPNLLIVTEHIGRKPHSRAYGYGPPKCQRKPLKQ